MCPHAAALPRSSDITAVTGANAAGGRILVLDDEELLAQTFVRALTNAGYGIVGPARNVEGALRLIERESPDAALLDVQLSAETSYPVADALAAKGVPFLFMSGYGAEGVDARYRAVGCLSKPSRIAVMLAAVGDMLHPKA